MVAILNYHVGRYDTSMESLDTIVNHTMETFTTYTDNHLFTKIRCRKIKNPRVEAIVAFDGAGSQKNTANFLA